MSTNTLVNENLNNNNNGTSTTTINNDGPIAHLDHMVSSLHDEQQQQTTATTTRMPSNVSVDAFDGKSHRMNHRSTSRATITDGKIVESSSENAIVYRYYTGESSSIIDEHFDKALKQPISFNSPRAISTRDPRTSSYGYSTMMNPSTGFWPNFMASSTSYPHPTYLPSTNEYSDWMHHHTYRSPYSTNPTTTSSSSPSTSTLSNNHLHPIGSPNPSNTNNNNNNNNTGRYHHHTSPDMDVVTAAAIGAAAAAQMFHHEKQTHHGYTPTSHHFDYHLGGSMMPTASYGFSSQSFDLMGTATPTLGLENPTMKDSTTSSPWYSNHHLSC